MSDTATWQQQIEAICAQTARKILIGPFRQELGFELLYWVPFVRWVREQYHVAPERLIVASRGGAGIFYKVPMGVELYKLRTLQELRTANTLDWSINQSLKQRELTAFDRELIQGAEYDLRLKVEVLHPGLMFAAFNEAWHEKAAPRELFDHLRFTRLAAPPLPADVTLPEHFTAVRFYSRATLPHTGQVLHWVRATMRRLCGRGPVVALEPPEIADDHYGFALPDHPNLIRVRDAITLEESFAVQGAILGRAKQFVGTYGGMQQMALLMGIPSVGYYSTWEGTLPVHLEVSQRLARAGNVPFYVVKVDDEARLRGVL